MVGRGGGGIRATRAFVFPLPVPFLRYSFFSLACWLVPGNRFSAHILVVVFSYTTGSYSAKKWHRKIDYKGFLKFSKPGWKQKSTRIKGKFLLLTM